MNQGQRWRTVDKNEKRQLIKKMYAGRGQTDRQKSCFGEKGVCVCKVEAIRMKVNDKLKQGDDK